MLLFKDGVKINGAKPELLIALLVAEAVYSEFGHDLTVTACTDGKHSRTSLHYVGFAIDLRTREFSNAEKQAVAQRLRVALTDEFDVVVEATHIHLEFQPKGK